MDSNLPELEFLDLAYNSLSVFDFDYFDQVGTLSSLRVNASHNKIVELFDNNTGYSLGRGEHAFNSCHVGTIYHSDIKILDLSHNNISKINPGFFRPAERSLNYLYLGYNSLVNATRNMFGNIPHLECLDISHNQIEELDFDVFKNTKQLQVLDISHNQLDDLPPNVFESIDDLRVVDLSFNYLRSLPDNLFSEDGMETLDLSHNMFLKIPVLSMSNLAAMTLCELDLSFNIISSIHSMDLSNKFRSLSSLDLSNNRLFRLDDAAFATLPSLSVLDLSNNEDLKVMDKTFVGLQNSLIKLNLNNISLSTVPELPLKFLRVLKLAHNELPSIPQELAKNMTELRELDISDNDLTSIPILLNSLPNLRSLSIAGNSITILTNHSFNGLSDYLEHLDISDLNLNIFELGALQSLKSLRSLCITTYPNIRDFNIPDVIENIENLRKLQIEAPIEHTSTSTVLLEASSNAVPNSQPKKSISTDLRKEMIGLLPSKLRSVTISGTGFTQIGDNIFNGIQSPSLHISLFNTSISTVSINLFKHLGEAYNISLDVRFNNGKLLKVSNPNTGNLPHMPEQVFLTDFKVAGNSLSCDCGIGWVEFWQRKKRQYFCQTQSWSETFFGGAGIYVSTTGIHHDEKEQCNVIDDELREVKCSNKQNLQLIEVLKSDIECGWDSAASKLNTELIFVIGLCSAILLLWF